MNDFTYLTKFIIFFHQTKSDAKSTEDNKGAINDRDEDFFKKQARLQQEAKIALAQVCQGKLFTHIFTSLNC